MADFPTSVYAPRTKQNRSGVVYTPANTKQIFAEDIILLENEVIALITALLAIWTPTDSIIEINLLTVNDNLWAKTIEVGDNISLPARGLRILNTSTPASASASGVKGTICWDSNYIYVCTATNTWKRVAISTW